MNPSLSGYTSAEDGRDFVEPESTPWLTLLPGNHNADTLGARPDIIGRPIESWPNSSTRNFPAASNCRIIRMLA